MKFSLIIVPIIDHRIGYTIPIKGKGDGYMAVLLVVLTFVVAGLCLARRTAECRRFFREVAALLYLPIGTLVSLIRQCR